MRVLLVAASLVTFAALSGCVAPEAYAVWDPSFQGGNATAQQNLTSNQTVQGNLTAPPPVAPPGEPPEPEVPPVPIVPYEADTPIELAREETRAVSMSLVAGPDGLTCVAEPARDPPPAPAGYAIEGFWAECRLHWEELTIGEGRSDTAAAEMLVVPGIPVDHFTWTMTAGRILVNNTGTHDEVLAEVDMDVLAGPSASLSVNRDGDSGYPFYSYHHEVCDASDAIEAIDGPWGVETFTYSAHAHNGRAVLWWPDFGDLEVLDSWIAGELVEDERGKRIVGPWGHESTASLKFTADYENDGTGFITYSLACLGALFGEWQDYALQATAEGIAAGWEDAHEGVHRVKVVLVGI